MKISQIDSVVKGILPKRRYQHSLRTAETARKLAKIHGASEKKVTKAALLHDVGYFVGRSKKDRTLSHAGISARYAKKIGIKDESVLDAILWHTVGHPGLDLVGKILFIADGIEPERKFPMIDIIRKLAKKDLDGAILMYVQMTRTYLHQKGKRMSTHTIQMRDEIVRHRRTQTKL